MFALTIPVSSDRLEAIKAELTRSLPDVKSSHRCEALARGLGFRTYAAALTATKMPTHGTVRVHGDLFSDYLRDHGFAVSPSALYNAAAKIALRDVAERFPGLTLWGMGIGQPRRKSDGRWEDYQDRNAKFRTERAALVGDGAVKPFLTSLALLEQVTPTKTVRQGTGSYRLKHIAENYACTYPEGEELGPVYVPNGAFIAAALHACFKLKTYVDERGYDAVNVSFNMSKRCLDDLDCQIRPDGARAQERRRRAEMKQRQHYPFQSVAL